MERLTIFSATKKIKNHHRDENSVENDIDYEPTAIKSSAAKLAVGSWCGLILMIRNLQNSIIVKDVLWARLWSDWDQLMALIPKRRLLATSPHMTKYWLRDVEVCAVKITSKIFEAIYQEKLMTQERKREENLICMLGEFITSIPNYF